MRVLGLPFLARLRDLAPTALRLGVGFVFISYGYSKLSGGPEQFAGMLTGLGVASPTLFAWLVTIAELVGGSLLVVGLLTRLVTLPLIATLVGAIILVKADAGMPEAGIDIALLAGLAALLLMGPGRLSVDRLMGIEPDPIQSTSTGDRHATSDTGKVELHRERR